MGGKGIGTVEQRKQAIDLLTRAGFRIVDPSYGNDRAYYDALDALESMVCQYLRYDNDPENFYNHAFMSAGEHACGVLCDLRPERWRETPCGMEFIGDND